MGTPLGKLYFLTPLSGKGVVRGISLKWNAVGTGAYGIWRVVDLSKRTAQQHLAAPVCGLHQSSSAWSCRLGNGHEARLRTPGLYHTKVHEV